MKLTKTKSNRHLPRGLQSHQLQLVLCRPEPSSLRERDDSLVRTQERTIELLRPIESHPERVDQSGDQHLQLLLQQRSMRDKSVNSRPKRIVQCAHVQCGHHLQFTTHQYQYIVSVCG